MEATSKKSTHIFAVELTAISGSAIVLEVELLCATTLVAGIPSAQLFGQAHSRVLVVASRQTITSEQKIWSKYLIDGHLKSLYQL